MKHTDAEIEEAARRFEALADELDPETADVEDLADLRAIAEAAERTRRDEALLTERVALARAHGRSWNRVAGCYAVFSQTETWLLLSLVKGSRFQPLQRSRKVIPASRAIRSSSDGHT